MRKITKEDIDEIRAEVVADWPKLGPREVAFALLFDSFDDPQMVADAIFHEQKVDGRAAVVRADVLRLRNAIRMVMASKDLAGGQHGDTLSKEENRSELIKMIETIQHDMDDGLVERKDGLKMIADIRVKLNDKFEIEEANTQRRLIVVPQKRDMICKHTQRECTFWPTKEACMQHYGLKQ